MSIVVLSTGTDSFAQFMTAILIFLFVLALTYYTTRFIGKIQKNQLISRNFEAIESYKITNGKYLQLVKIGTKYVVIGIGKDSISMICELSEEEVTLSKEQEAMPDAFKNLMEKAKMRIGKRDDSHDE